MPPLYCNRNKVGPFLIVVQLCLGFVLAQVNPITNCPKLPPYQPKDVNDLSPTSIKVVIALGDSINAGFGAMGRGGGIEEYRGVSGSIGGDAGAITIPNFLQHYSPDVIGASTGEHLAELPGEGFYSNDNLNAAQSAARTTDFNYQLSYIIKQLKQNPRVNMTSDWKAMIILIGANDACPLCWEWNRPSVQEAGNAFENTVRAAVQFAYENIPRLLINIIPLFNVSQVYNLSLNTDYCSVVHDILPFECPCAFDTSQANRNYLDSVITEYRSRIISISDFWRAKNLPEFNVIYQPFTIGLKIPSLDYLSTLDCFHPSLYAHQKVAIAGWNSIITPYPQKKHYLDPDEPLQCPTPDTRFWTNYPNKH